MEEGVAYMMMGDGGDAVQPAQLVALQSEDGTQQLAVPVIDPNTGQETYMILDQNALEGEDGQQLLIVGDGEGAQLVQGDGGLGQSVGGDEDYSIGEDQNGVLIVPSSISTSLNSSTDSGSMVYVSAPPVQESVNDLSMVDSLGSGLNVPEKEGGMIHVVGVKEEKHTQIKQQNRQPRKQHLSANTDFSQDDLRIGEKSQEIDSYTKDASLLKNRVNDVALKAKYRSRGSGVVRGRGRPRKFPRPKVIKCDQCQLEFPANVSEERLIDHVQRFHLKRDKPKVAKSYLDPEMPVGPQCYKCSDCSQSFLKIRTLLDHQKEAHSRETEIKKSISTPTMTTSTTSKPSAPLTSTMEASDPLPPPSSETKLQPQESPVSLDYPDSPSKQKVEVIKKLADEWDDEDDGDGEGCETLSEGIPREILASEVAAPNFPQSQVESSTNHSNDAVAEQSIDLNGDVSRDIKVGGGLSDRLKKDEDEEEKIVADVDDILSETDRLVSSVDSLLTQKARNSSDETIPSCGSRSTAASLHTESHRKRQPATADVDGDDEEMSAPTKKKPTVQCEECYECFEDEEKLAWHNLNDH